MRVGTHDNTSCRVMGLGTICHILFLLKAIAVNVSLFNFLLCPVPHSLSVEEYLLPTCLCSTSSTKPPLRQLMMPDPFLVVVPSFFVRCRSYCKEFDNDLANEAEGMVRPRPQPSTAHMLTRVRAFDHAKCLRTVTAKCRLFGTVSDAM